MRFFIALIYVLSLACLALGVRLPAGLKLPFTKALQVGKIPLIKPKSWGSTVSPGNNIRHPVAVVSNDGKAATVAQFTHNPIKGQDAIRTSQIAPSFDKPDKHGKDSHVVLNPYKLDLKTLRNEKGNSHIKVMGELKAHELGKLKAAIANNPGRGTPAALGRKKASSKTSGKKAAIVGGKKAAVRQAAKKAALKKAAGPAAKNGATAARQKAAVKLAQKKNPGSGHHT
ncbi:hypothetical protein M378DRAFT_163993 [Amanita muscaria Koide BX008]|uniref:Uncharacterized protein n=1 Tax=Amanita muscaria (strain Koide BX008) TaxID=946122 RepID=A0A0C2TAQ8_AMAMK|nr:hypothetical protein M378DRAFT_163993 [Amanita muscaria Koide BX008]